MNPPAPESPSPFLIWNRKTILKTQSWSLSWPDSVLRDILQKFDSGGVETADLEKINPSLGEIPSLREWVTEEIQTELRLGTGFVRIEAPWIPLTEKQLRFAYLVLGWALGPTIERYGRLYDVIDQGSSYTETRIPVSQTQAETRFHTDSSARHCLPEFVGLLCIRPAASGGTSQLVHALHVHERLSQRHPELLSELYRPWIRNIVTPGTEFNLENLKANRIPVFEKNPGRFSGIAFRYMRYWIEKGHELAGEPLSTKAIEAMNRLDEELHNPENFFEFDLKASEILMIHNARLAHNRTEFQDPQDATAGSRRRLVRMWINELMS